VADVNDTSGWAPKDIDLSRPAVARMYDYLLGGAHNFAVDRAAADRAIAALPFLPAVAFANRDFLRRAVQFFTAEGIDQVLDLGSGIPTVGNVHEVAQATNPSARTVYVDVDPVAVAHARALLSDDSKSDAILADLRHPRRVFEDPAVRRLIDWTRPVAVLMVAVLHFVPDEDDPYGVVAAYRDQMAPGSYLALSHASRDDQPDDMDEAVDQAARAYDDTGTGLVFRTRRQLAELLDGFVPVEPGIVPVPQWRPEPGGESANVGLWRHGLAAVGHVTATVWHDETRGASPRTRNTVLWPTNSRVSRKAEPPIGGPRAVPVRSSSTDSAERCAAIPK
jgi:SAM-dependent methyltransferase